MTANQRYDQDPDHPTPTARLVGFYAALSTTVITLITFGLALTAIPISGANCPGDCIDYPYLDTLAQYPRDFRWMIPAIGLVLVYVVLVVAIHANADRGRQIFSQIGLTFAIMAAVILVSDYFVQFSVIPVSLLNNETEGLALLIQYNPHGIFLALEELGYLLMSLSFLFIAPVFASRSRLETAVQWLFNVGFILPLIALGVIAFLYGLERQDRFEVVIISVNWLVLIVNGVLLSVHFRR